MISFCIWFSKICSWSLTTIHSSVCYTLWEWAEITGMDFSGLCWHNYIILLSYILVTSFKKTDRHRKCFRKGALHHFVLGAHNSTGWWVAFLLTVVQLWMTWNEVNHTRLIWLLLYLIPSIVMGVIQVYFSSWIIRVPKERCQRWAFILGKYFFPHILINPVM